MKRLLSFLFVCLPMIAAAQGLKTEGFSAKDLVPDGWEVKETRGDLNKDGIEDLVIIATPNIAENMMTRDDGYVYNFNAPILAIYFGSADGMFRLWKKYEDIIAHQVDEYLFIGNEAKITSKGTLQISLEYFASAGSSSSYWYTYTFRYQKNDFALIGKDEKSLSRYSGEEVEVSNNYLTRKSKTTTSNAFNEDIKPKEVWKTLPKKPLELLGDFKIE